jgi:hypothetical protein
VLSVVRAVEQIFILSPTNTFLLAVGIFWSEKLRAASCRRRCGMQRVFICALMLRPSPAHTRVMRLLQAVAVPRTHREMAAAVLMNWATSRSTTCKLEATTGLRNRPPPHCVTCINCRQCYGSPAGETLQHGSARCLWFTLQACWIHETAVKTCTANSLNRCERPIADSTSGGLLKVISIAHCAALLSCRECLLGVWRRAVGVVAGVSSSLRLC